MRNDYKHAYIEDIEEQKIINVAMPAYAFLIELLRNNKLKFWEIPQNLRLSDYSFTVSGLIQAIDSPDFKGFTDVWYTMRDDLLDCYRGLAKSEDEWNVFRMFYITGERGRELFPERKLDIEKILLEVDTARVNAESTQLERQINRIFKGYY
jgi:hypothetical protein